MSTPFLLQIPRRLHEEMVAQALSERPNECCGLLAGSTESSGLGARSSEPVCRVAARFPLVNEAASPVRYQSEPRSLFDAVRNMRQGGIELLAIYHSHPTSEPVPSRTDLENNHWPDVVHLIISLQAKEPAVRGWWLTATEFREASWELVE